MISTRLPPFNTANTLQPKSTTTRCSAASASHTHAPASFQAPAHEPQTLSPMAPHHFTNKSSYLPPGIKSHFDQKYRALGITLPNELQTIPDSLADAVAKIPNTPFSMIKRYIEIEKHLPVKPHCASKLLEVPNPKGLVILFHGFSAGTWQFDEWQQQYLDKGYNVFVPRLVGHGLVQASNPANDDLSHLPVADRPYAWQRFCQTIYALAAECQLPLHVSGISGGATCAAFIADRFDINSVYLMAPYFSAPRRDAKALMKAEALLGALTLHQTNRLLNAIKVPLKRTPEQNRHDLVYKKITLGSEMCLRQFGASVLENLTRINVPGKLITSESDIAADQKPIERLWGKFSNPVSHIRFAKALEVPHTMLNTFEYDNPDVVNHVKIEALALAECNN